MRPNRYIFPFCGVSRRNVRANRYIPYDPYVTYDRYQFQVSVFASVSARIRTSFVREVE